MRRLGVVGCGLMLLVLGHAACGGGGQVPVEPAGQAVRTDPVTGGSTGRDLSALDVCDLVPGEAVAEVLGGTLAREPSGSVYGSMSTDCSYAVDLGGVPEVVMVFIYPAAYFESLEAGAENGRPLEGIGDRAFVATLDEFQQVVGLRSGDVVVEVRADELEDATRLAELVLSRL